jgi:hypothetical protein
MKRKGQMTLEIVVMLLLVINIYLYVTNPSGDLSLIATETVGDAALAMKAVNDISQKAQLVGISGNGSRDWLEVEVRESFEGFSCTSGGKNLRLNLSYFSDTLIDSESDPPTLGLTALQRSNTTIYSNAIDFDMICASLISVPVDKDYTACVCLENIDSKINITVYERPSEGCDCVGLWNGDLTTWYGSN